MLPELRVPLGPWLVVVSTHATAVAIAVLAGTSIAARRVRHPLACAGWAPLLAMVVLAGSHLLQWMRAGGAFDLRYGGLASMGGVAGLAAGSALVARVWGMPLAEVADAVAPAALVALGIGRLGCFLAGCCAGIPTTLPWGVVFPELGPPPRHPLQLYAAALDVTLASAVARKAGPPGLAASRTMAGYGALRLGLELLRDPVARDPLVAGVATAQLGAVLLLAAGLLEMRRVRQRVALPASGERR
jgi:prolipoprotein diacylglyceryltransferase